MSLTGAGRSAFQMVHSGAVGRRPQFHTVWTSHRLPESPRDAAAGFPGMNALSERGEKENKH